MGLDSSDCPAILDRATRPSLCFKTVYFQHTNIFNRKKMFKNYTCLMIIKLSTLQVPKGRKDKPITGTAQAPAGVTEVERGLPTIGCYQCNTVFSLKCRAQAAGNSHLQPTSCRQEGGRALLPALYSPHPCCMPSMVRGQTPLPERQEALLF